MEYDKLIEETKNALENYSGVSAELEMLYRKARENNDASYELAKKDINDQYNNNRNAAVTKGKLDEKDMAQYLAARGLTASGESIQSKIDSNISVNNTLSELARENASSLSKLEQEKWNNENKLNTELADKKLELDQWQTELAAQIAELKNSKTSASKTTSGNDGSADEPSSENKYVPETTAKELAKSILSTYSTNGNVTTALQKSYIKQYIKTLSETENVDPDYIKELIINLKSAGYTDITDTTAEATVAADKGKSYYTDVFDQFYNIYIKGNRTQAQAEKLADNQARKSMLDYIYQRCSTKQSFERACKLVGVTDIELQEYYSRLDNINKK